MDFPEAGPLARIANLRQGLEHGQVVVVDGVRHGDERNGCVEDGVVGEVAEAVEVGADFVEQDVSTHGWLPGGGGMSGTAGYQWLTRMSRAVATANVHQKTLVPLTRLRGRPGRL